MKNVVFNDMGREAEFKPDPIFKKYLKMTESDIKKEFNDRKKLKDSDCPACESRKNTKAFTKFDFQYVECQNCGTVYMSPHMEDKEIKEHFLNSQSIRFWRDTLSKATRDKRKEKIYSHRWQWINDTMEEYLPGDRNIADLNSKNMDYVIELLNNKYFNKKLIVNPYFNIEDTTDNDLKRKLSLASDPRNLLTDKNSINIATLFEVIDYTSDVDSLMKTTKNLLCKGGLCFMTTISISGFDLQVLWENSRSIFPIDRINVLSHKGLELLFKRHGFEMLEFSTPGVLDFDIVESEFKKHPDMPIPRFIKTVLERDDEQLKQDFQNFLQVNKLSSFTRIVLRKK